MEIKVNIDRELMKRSNPIDFENAIQKGLLQAGQIVRNAASENAPYKTGTLRRSIAVNTDQIRQGIVLVGSPVVYARIREYVNNLHPERKYYFGRAYEENEDRITNLFNSILNNIFR